MAVLLHHILRSWSLNCHHFTKGWSRSCWSVRSVSVFRGPILSDWAYQANPFTLQRRTLIRKHELIDKVGSTKYLVPQHKLDNLGPEYEFAYGSSNIKVYKYSLIPLFIFGLVVVVLCLKVIIESHIYGVNYEPVHVHKMFESEDPLFASYIMLVLASALLFGSIYCYRYVLLRIYYNESSKEFVAVMLKNGLFTHKVHFKPSDVLHLQQNSVKGNIVIRGYQVSCTDKNFTSTRLYNIFRGYDLSRTGALEDRQESEDLGKIIAVAKKNFQDEQNKQFVDKYQEKRKLKQQKKT